MADSMFSILAEETSKLTHAFLGALFSVILIFGEENFWAVFALMFFLLSIFLANGVAIHFSYKHTHERHKGAYWWKMFFSVIYIGGYIAVWITYYSSVFYKFADKTHPVIMLGITTFGVFLTISTVTNLSVIQQGVGLSDRQRG